MYSKSKIISYSLAENPLNYEQISLIRNTVRGFGIPTNFIGYNYIIDALIYMINSKENLFLNEVYGSLSKSHKTSSECIEASIRNAIKKAVLLNNTSIRETLNVPQSVNLSNSVFLNSTKEVILEKISA